MHSETPQKASFFRRLLAFGLDVFMGALLVFALLFFQEHYRTSKAYDKDKHYERSETGVPQWFTYTLDSLYEREFEPGLLLKGIVEESNIAFPIILFFPWLIFTLSYALLGASPGKLLFGLRVRGLDGQKVSVGKVSVRYFGKWLSALPLFAGYFMVLFSGQTLHDRMNKTAVFRA
jgi:uncharacterized RDD family membrane protein YckC